MSNAIKSTKKKIAFITPWPPEMTGVGEYAYDLICGLNQKKLYDLTVVTGCANPIPIEGIKILVCNNEANIPDLTGQDIIIHQFGNNSVHMVNYWVIKTYGGIVQIHDLVLHDLVRRICHLTSKKNWLYKFLRKFSLLSLIYKMLEKVYGRQALQTVLLTMRKPSSFHHMLQKWYSSTAVDIEKNLYRSGGGIYKSGYVIEYPLFEEMLQYADAVIVHSDFAKSKIQKVFPELSVTYHPLQYDLDNIVGQANSLKLGDKFIIGTFGFSDKFKHTDKIVKAFAMLIKYCSQENKDKPVLMIVGPGDFSNEKKIADQLQISKHVNFIAEPPLDKFNALIKAMNLVIQLRYPTRGETSAAATKAVQLGVPVVVSDIGWYKELPEFIEKTVSPPDINAVFNIMRKIIFPGVNELSFAERVNISKAYAKGLGYHQYLQHYCESIDFFIDKTNQQKQISQLQPHHAIKHVSCSQALPKMQVLVDISTGLGGYAGIPQDTRFLFSAISEIEETKTSGFIYGDSSTTLFHNINNIDKDDLVDKTKTTALLLSEIIQPELYYAHPQFIVRQLQKLKRYKLLSTIRTFKMALMENEIFYDLIWRNIFSKSISPNLYQTFRRNDFYVSHFNLGSLEFHAAGNRRVQLDTSPFDFVIFQDQRPCKVSNNTIKIIRYHDPFPLTDIETSDSPKAIWHTNAMKLCANDSFYVCNSEPTLDALLRINPSFETRSAVIPCVLSDYYFRKNDPIRLKQIFENRVVQKKYFPVGDFEYILAVSTLEPRKNYISLVRAYQKMLVRCGDNKNIKLVIVGNSGWKNTGILQEMQPLIEKGILIHLQGLAPEEMLYIYSHALTFAFPSFNEGFGIPPLEAMQCECPVVAADIKTHRWVMGNAAMYCNPYDIDSIAHCLEKMTYDPESTKIRQEYIQKGLQRTQLYSQETIKEQWQVLFAKLKAEKN